MTFATRFTYHIAFIGLTVGLGFYRRKHETPQPL